MHKKRYNSWLSKLKRDIGEKNILKVFNNAVNALNVEIEQIETCEIYKRKDLVLGNAKNPAYFKFTDSSCKVSLADIKQYNSFQKKNIHSKEWQWMGLIHAKELNNLIFTKDELLKVVDGRIVIDSFGNYIDNDRVFETASILATEKYPAFLLILPPISSLAEDLRSRFDNVYRRFFSDHNSSYLPKELYSAPEVVLFFMDHEDVLTIKNKKEYTYQFSHSKHVMQHADNFLQNGYDILITQHGSGKYHHVDQIFPRINILNTWKSWVQDENNESLPFDIKGVFSIYAQDFQHGIPGVNMWLQPAVHWIENAQFFPLDFGAALAVNSPLMDIIISQNSRMIELTRSLVELSGARLEDDSYLIGKTVHDFAKPSSKKRQALRSKLKLTNKKVIINGGGAWDWTATYEFLDQLVNYYKKNPSSNIVFIQCGLRQKSNSDHQETYDGIMKLSKNNPKIFNKINGKIRLLDWDDASELLPDILNACDYGFGCSKVSVEAFQAHRVRNSEYLAYGLPVIMNEFDVMADSLSNGGAFKINNSLDFSSALEKIEKEKNTEYETRKKDILSFHSKTSKEIISERDEIIRIFERKKDNVARSKEVYSQTRDMQSQSAIRVLENEKFNNKGFVISRKDVTLHTQDKYEEKSIPSIDIITSGYYSVPTTRRSTFSLIFRLTGKLVISLLPNFIASPLKKSLLGWYKRKFINKPS